MHIGDQSYNRSNYHKFQDKLGDFHLSLFDESFTNIHAQIFVFNKIDSDVVNHLPQSLNDARFPLLVQKFGGEKLGKVLPSRVTKNDIVTGQGIF